MLKQLNKKCKTFWRHYVIGYYHCDRCPMCWVDYAYEGDCDCGCYIFGDIRDSCRLLPPFRQLIGWPKKRKAQYWAVHQYDGCGEQFEQIVEQDFAMEKVLIEALSGYEICQRDFVNGVLSPVCKAEWIDNNRAEIRYTYEEKCHPYVYTPLKTEWKNVLSRTWNAFLDIFRPYFCKCE